MSAAPAPPEILDGGAGFPGGGPAADLRAVFGDLMRLHAEAAGIRAEARHRVPHDLDERLAGLARGLGRAAGRLSTSCTRTRSSASTPASSWSARPWPPTSPARTCNADGRVVLAVPRSGRSLEGDQTIGDLDECVERQDG